MSEFYFDIDSARSAGAKPSAAPCSPRADWCWRIICPSAHLRRRRPPRAKAVIQIWMWGGPSHLDTFDPKPEAGYDYCGPLKKPIDTNVSGIRICELLPLLAKQADKYSIIRSMTHGNNGHETAVLHRADRTAAGRAAGLSLRRRGGFAVQRIRCRIQGLIPPYIVLTEPQGRFPRRVSWARATNLCHRRRSGADAVRRRRRRGAGHHRAAAERPPRTCSTS